MEDRIIPVTVMDVIDMLISGREKLATELVDDLLNHKELKLKRTIQR